MLAGQEAQPLFDLEGNDIANVYGVPPDWKPLLAYHLTRMWAAGEVTYSEGSCKVTTGSPTVTGFGTNWKSEYAGRYLHVLGATQSYLIDSVNETSQTITLDENYADASDLFAGYSIKAAPAERPLVYFSEAGLPEAWPAVNALSLPEDGDVVTGLMPMGSWLYVLKRRHAYRITAQANPRVDAFIFKAADRGCCNNRCWVIADETAYLLDEGGIHSFDGEAPTNISIPISTLFQNGPHLPRVNWSAKRTFHAVWYPAHETIRWYVCLYGDFLPRHAICYAYRRQVWWIEEVPSPSGSSTLGRTGRPTGGWADGGEQVYIGGPASDVLALDGSPLDGPVVGSVASRGQVTSAGIEAMTDANASFPDLVGFPVALAAGRGIRPGPGYRLQRRHDAAPRPPVGRQAGRDVHVPDRRHPLPVPLLAAPHGPEREPVGDEGRDHVRAERRFHLLPLVPRLPARRPRRLHLPRRVHLGQEEGRREADQPRQRQRRRRGQLRPPPGGQHQRRPVRADRASGGQRRAAGAVRGNDALWSRLAWTRS
jgi:hypothetical protein